MLNVCVGTVWIYLGHARAPSGEVSGRLIRPRTDHVSLCRIARVTANSPRYLHGHSTLLCTSSRHHPERPPTRSDHDPGHGPHLIRASVRSPVLLTSPPDTRHRLG